MYTYKSCIQCVKCDKWTDYESEELDETVVYTILSIIVKKDILF